MAYVRTVKRGLRGHGGAETCIRRGGSRDIEHIGSAHGEKELEILKAAVRQRLAAGQGQLELGLDDAAGRGVGASDQVVADGAPVGRAVPGL